MADSYRGVATSNRKSFYARIAAVTHCPMPNTSASMPRASGIYGAFQLDGCQLDPVSASVLGLPAPGVGTSWAIAGHDHFAPDAVSRHDEGGASTLLAGYIEDARELARRLGLDRTCSPARIAQAALARFGSDTPTQVMGDWSLLHRAADGIVTLMVGAGVRDPIFYAASHHRLALAPDLFALARLDWVDSGIDAAGLLFPVARAQLRAARGDTTMLRGVRQLSNGASVTISPQGEVTLRQATVLVEQPRWHGSFDDLVAEAEHVLRHIIAAKLARTHRSAHMLSGGLDSSLLAWLASEEAPTDRVPIAVTSAAPPGSGLPDETAFADIVARTIGMACFPVWPDEAANIYRPKHAILTGQNGPPYSNRHGLTDALVMKAQAQGATLMIDGIYGEMSVTVRLAAEGLKQRLRERARQAYRALRPIKSPETVFSPFHVRLAPHRMAALPEVMTAALAKPTLALTEPSGTDLFGYMDGVERALGHPTAFYPGALRTEYPFRDMRLLRLFAGVSVSTILQGGADRSVVRRMMAGHLPDSIRLRRRGMPASPDHNSRLQYQASAARDRIALFRKAGIDDWLDLDWLDHALAGMAITGPVNVTHGNEVQLTAMMAEFLLWWGDQARSTTP
jgi:asparagine synthase (glutamine-hydrolysing)